MTKRFHEMRALASNPAKQHNPNGYTSTYLEKGSHGDGHDVSVDAHVRSALARDNLVTVGIGVDALSSVHVRL